MNLGYNSAFHSYCSGQQQGSSNHSMSNVPERIYEQWKLGITNL